MRRGQRGSVLVEAGFAIPLLLLLFLGIADLGRIFRYTNEAIAGASHAEHVVFASGDDKAITEGAAKRFYTCPNSNGSDSASTEHSALKSCPGERTYVRIVVSTPFKAVTPHPGIPYPANAQATAVVRLR